MWDAFRLLYAPPPDIAGLTYKPTFISKEEEASLLAFIDQQPWLSDLQRRVQHYGYRYDYRARVVTPSMYLGPLPDLFRKLAGQLTGTPDSLNQSIVNEYLPGQGIAPHIDCVPCFGDTIATLSLGSPCEMEFGRTGEKKGFLLQPQSMLILQGEARYQWTHCIRGRKSDFGVPRSRRVSITFRSVTLA